MSGSPPPIAELRELWYRYGDGAPVLRGINLSLAAGDWIAIMGYNGSGKSTLVKHLNGLLRPWKGQVLLAGEDTTRRSIGELARLVAYLPQNPDRLIFSPSVWDEVAFGPRQHGLSGAALEGRVEEALAVLGLNDYARIPPAVLGYGLRRQVALAAVLAQRPRLLVLDEPTVGLDAGCTAQIMGVVEGLRGAGVAVVVVTHDLELAARYARTAVLLRAGEIVAHGPVRGLLADTALLREAGLLPLPVTRLAGMLAADCPGFPTDVLAPAEFARAYRAARAAEPAP